MKNSPYFSKLRVESLEERTLLAVMAGGLETAVRTVAPTESVIWVVDTLEDSWGWTDDVVSLREAIGCAMTGDTIVFDSELAGGAITLNGSQLEINNGITIDASAIGGITIDAVGQSRVFYISGGNAENPVEMIGLTITGGYASDNYGGGIYNYNSTLTLTDSAVLGNTANYGGGIYNNDSTLILTGSSVEGNTAADYGGGICNDGKLTLTDSAVSGNTANYGSGIYNNSTLTLAGSSVEGNTADYGGGIYNDYNGTLTVTNSTISENAAISGGGIYNEGRTLTLAGLSVVGNNASIGGGIYNSDHSTLTLTDTAVSGNTAKGSGGGIFNYGTLTVTNSTVSMNAANSGGGIYNEGRTLSLMGSSVERNTADCGGGIYNDYNDTLTVTNSTISGNAANCEGGGIYNEGQTLSLMGSSVEGNTANYGGGIYNDYNGTLTVTGNTILGNSVNYEGGGIYNYGTLILEFCTISGNICIESGGGIYSCSDTLRITNSVLSGNLAFKGGGVYCSEKLFLINCVISGNYAYDCGGGIDTDNGYLEMTNCTVSGNSAEHYGGGIFANSDGSFLVNSIISLNYSEYDNEIHGEFTDENNIIGFDPGFVTPPVFESGKIVNLHELDLSLISGSIAIDGGNNVPMEYEIDVEGNPRIFAAMREPATIDIGAYEYQKRIQVETPSLVVTTSLDVVDWTDNMISLREAIEWANDGDTVSFAPELGGKTIVLSGREITIDKGITIDASSIGDISISGNEQSRIFRLCGGTSVVPVRLIGLTIRGGYLDGSCVGSGICNTGIASMASCVVYGNNSWNYDGGGIYNSGELSLTNCVVFGNTVDHTQIDCQITSTGVLSLTNCTVVGQNEYYSGDTISGDGTVTLVNTIVYGCIAPGSSKLITSINSIIGTDPKFKVAPIFESGKIINLDSVDLTLSSDSPAIDRGDNRFVESNTDAVGNQRISAAWKSTPTVDIGAYEYQGASQIAVITVTTASDIVNATDNQTSLREAIQDANDGDVIIFDSKLSGQTITLNGSELNITKSVTIDASEIDGIVIDAKGKSRVLNIEVVCKNWTGES